ncbi:MAG: hypothetical protein GY710_09035 [Desulfobacteraceae bacterium]|nr:hypothetical protein [Desulfobacteraceae bacterium]
MKNRFKKIFRVLIYFFTPEDSEKQIDHGFISFNIDSANLNIGTAKAIFWLINTMILFYLLTLI